MLGRITSVPTNATRKFMGNLLFEGVIVENVSTPPSKCADVPLAVPPPRPNLMFSCWLWSEKTAFHLCPSSCWGILKKEIRGIRCFWFSTFLPPKEEEEEKEKHRLFAATCFLLHRCTKRCFFTLFFSYRALLGWKGIGSGKINLLTIPGLINFQFCKSV